MSALHITYEEVATDDLPDTLPAAVATALVHVVRQAQAKSGTLPRRFEVNTYGDGDGRTVVQVECEVEAT